MSQTDSDIEIEITNGKKVKVNLSIREWLIICVTIALVTYAKFRYS